MPLDLAQAQHLDANDPLAACRAEFSLPDPRLIYLDGNSLGRLPATTSPLLQQLVTTQWGEDLIRGWNKAWLGLPARLSHSLAHLLDAQPGEILFCDSTSVNLFKLVCAALRAKPGRRKIVSDALNFPTDLYVLQGVIDLLGQGHHLEIVPSRDAIHVADADLERAIDSHTALVCLSHVAFKSAFLYDMPAITRLAHAAGAWMLWDLSHSAGAVPLQLNASQVDLAVGCSYKYLNGGPGAPAYLYVRQDLQEQLVSPIWGWFADRRPFEFNLDFAPAAGIQRFAAGTPPILALQAIAPGLELLIQAGLPALRQKSIALSEYLLELAEAWLFPLGFSLGSPRRPDQRGSHVSLRHPEAYRINRAMIEPAGEAPVVIPDFRAPDNIRLGLAPLYTTFEEVYLALRRIQAIVESGEYTCFSPTPSGVT
jgi:kynureninase